MYKHGEKAGIHPPNTCENLQQYERMQKESYTDPYSTAALAVHTCQTFQPHLVLANGHQNSGSFRLANKMVIF